MPLRARAAPWRRRSRSAPGPTMTGLMSRSATSGTSMASRPSRRGQLRDRQRSRPVTRHGSRRGAATTRRDCTTLIASDSWNGGTRKARSSHTSVATPPAPIITSGPNDGSLTTPSTSSTPVAIGWTRTGARRSVLALEPGDGGGDVNQRCQARPAPGRGWCGARRPVQRPSPPPGTRRHQRSHQASAALRAKRPTRLMSYESSRS